MTEDVILHTGAYNALDIRWNEQTGLLALSVPSDSKSEGTVNVFIPRPDDPSTPPKNYQDMFYNLCVAFYAAATATEKPPHPNQRSPDLGAIGLNLERSMQIERSPVLCKQEVTLLLQQGRKGGNLVIKMKGQNDHQHPSKAGGQATLWPLNELSINRPRHYALETFVNGLVYLLKP